MKSIDFPEANHALAKDQPEYNTLFVHIDGNKAELPMYVCFALTDEDIADIVKNRKVWYDQLTFGHAFQPMAILTKNPFTNPHEDFPAPADENRMTVEAWDKSHYKGTEGIIYPGQGYVILGPCSNCGKEPQQHFFSSRQCELLLKENL